MGQNLTYRPLPGSRLNMAHPMARNMALCMLFNEQGSRAMDLSPYQANGRLHGFGSPAKRHIGGLDFVAATPSYVEIPASFTQLNFTSEDFSIVTRVNAKSLGGDELLFWRGNASVSGYYFYIDALDRLEFVTVQGGPTFQRSYTADASIIVATDYTIGLSRNGAAATLLINGVDSTSKSGNHTDPATHIENAMIGVASDLTSSPLDGKMEFFYIWRRRALSELEHRAVHEQPYSPFGYNLFI